MCALWSISDKSFSFHRQLQPISVIIVDFKIDESSGVVTFLPEKNIIWAERSDVMSTALMETYVTAMMKIYLFVCLDHFIPILNGYANVR